MSFGSAPRAALFHHLGILSSSDHCFPKNPAFCRNFCCSINVGMPTDAGPESTPAPTRSPKTAPAPFVLPSKRSIGGEIDW